ncbi:hypothetical protein D3C85_1811870 [compost metagenome]
MFVFVLQDTLNERVQLTSLRGAGLGAPELLDAVEQFDVLIFGYGQLAVAAYEFLHATTPYPR